MLSEDLYQRKDAISVCFISICICFECWNKLCIYVCLCVPPWRLNMCQLNLSNIICIDATEDSTHLPVSTAAVMLSYTVFRCHHVSVSIFLSQRLRFAAVWLVHWWVLGLQIALLTERSQRGVYGTGKDRARTVSIRLSLRQSDHCWV